MYDFFKEIALESEVKLSEKRVNSIKAAVLSRIKEENSMKKISVFKTFSIAAIVAATAAMSAMLASAEKPASLPTKQPAVEQSTPATAETPKDADEKDSNKENAANTENKSDTPTHLSNEELYNEWVHLELPNGNNAEIYVPDGKVPMKFDNVEAARDYAISHNMSSYSGGVFGSSDNIAVLLVDA